MENANLAKGPSDQASARVVKPLRSGPGSGPEEVQRHTESECQFGDGDQSIENWNEIDATEFGPV